MLKCHVCVRNLHSVNIAYVADWRRAPSRGATEVHEDVRGRLCVCAGLCHPKRNANQMESLHPGAAAVGRHGRWPGATGALVIMLHIIHTACLCYCAYRFVCLQAPLQSSAMSSQCYHDRKNQ